MYPDRDTLSNVPRSGYFTTRDQNMLESDVTEGEQNTARSCHWLPVFFFVNEHNNIMKPHAKKQRFSNISDFTRLRLVCHFFVLTTFWRHLWSITEQTHGNIESIC